MEHAAQFSSVWCYDQFLKSPTSFPYFADVNILAHLQENFYFTEVQHPFAHHRESDASR